MPIFSMFQVGRPTNLFCTDFKKLGLTGMLFLNVDLPPLAGKARILAVVAGGACNMMLALAIV